MHRILNISKERNYLNNCGNKVILYEDEKHSQITLSLSFIIFDSAVLVNYSIYDSIFRYD